MQGCLDSIHCIYVKKQKQQFINLLDVYFSDLHIFGFYDTVITVFTFNFLIYYTDINFKSRFKGIKYKSEFEI